MQYFAFEDFYSVIMEPVAWSFGLACVQVQHKMGEEKLVRILNPWADGTEWKGSWSDKYGRLYMCLGSSDIGIF